MSAPKATDAGIERMVSVLLITGVLISGSVVLAGGVLTGGFLVRARPDVCGDYGWCSQSCCSA